MGIKSKALLTIGLVGVVTAVMVTQSGTSNLFQGKLLGTDEAPQAKVSSNSDLIPEINLEVPSDKNENILVTATISNIGEGAINGGEEFVYTLSINGQEVLSNSDSYSELASGDSFSFNYPIPKTIYNYPNTGEVTFEVDSKNNISETNEENNSVSAKYNY